MSFSSSKIAFALIMTATTFAVAADDDLFSDVRTNAVFDSATGSDSDANTRTARPKAITDAKTLRELLKSAGFDARTEGNRSVTTTKQLDTWTFPVLVTISDNEKTIGIRLGLSVIKDEKQLSTETLLQLMSASQKHAPSQFTYSAKRKRTELSTFMTGNRLTGQQLRDEINRLAILANETSAVWTVADSRADSGNPSPDVPTPQTEPRTPSDSGLQQSLSGTWSAIRSNTEAFAVAFKADGTFNLVYVNDGKQTKTSGTFSITDESLTLAGNDGVRLVGKLTSVSDKEFRFAPQNTAVLIFTRAK